MKSLLRAVLVVALLGCAFSYPLQASLLAQSGTFGFAGDFTIANAPSITDRVTHLTPGTPASRAGLREGDLLPLASVDAGSRAALDYVLPGQRARFIVQRGSQSREVSIAAVPHKPYRLTIPDAIRTLVVYFVLAFALLVVVRAWHTPHKPLIAVILVAAVVDATADRIPWTVATSGPVATLFLGANAGLDAISTALGALLPVLLVAQLTHWRSRALTICAYAVAAYALFLIAYFPVNVVLAHRGIAGLFAEFANDWLMNTLPFIAGGLALLVAYVTVHDENRQRIGWIFWGFAPYLFGVGLLNASLEWQPTSDYYTPQSLTVAHSVFRAMEMALPISLFYGVLVRRVVDIGFVFNRVAIYGTLSIVLVGFFVLLEYGVSQVLETGRTGSLFIQVGIALIIGFSIRYLHGAVEHLVDRVLFAKRHADESALRRFAREAEVYSSAASLLDRSMEILSEHTESTGAAIYLTDDTGARAICVGAGEFPANVHIDDPLLVKLRRWNEPVDTHEARTAFPDGMVFPMCAQGKVIGALACRTKRDGSAFDPDERESLMEVARGVSAAMQSIAPADRTMLESLRESIRGLSEKLDALPRQIADLQNAHVAQ